MDDINFLSSGGSKKEEKPEKKPGATDEPAMHVPMAPPPGEKPSGKLSGLLGDLKEPAAKPEADLPAGIFRQKIESVPDIERPAPPPSPPPKPTAPPPPPKAAAIPTAKPLTKQAPPAKEAGSTLRVSLISTAAGASLTELTIRDRLRTFVLIIVLALVIDGLVYGGILYYKMQVIKRIQGIEAGVKDLDKEIAEGEALVKDAKRFQTLTGIAENVLKAHTHWTRLLALIEQLAEPQVQFVNLSGAESGSITSELIAKDYTTLARQLVALRQDPRVSKASIGTASSEVTAEGLIKGVRATLNMTVRPELFLAARAEALSGKFVFPKERYRVGDAVEGTFVLENYGEPFEATVASAGIAGGGFSAFELKDKKEFKIEATAAKAGELIFAYTLTKNGDETFQKVFERVLTIEE